MNMEMEPQQRIKTIDRYVPLEDRGIPMVAETTKNQLDRVICQIRFQPIFMVNAKIGEFQEKIKDEYPISQIKQSVQIVNMDVKDFVFTTTDGHWAVTTSMNSLSLTTTAYSTWEVFVSKFNHIFDVFMKCFGLNSIIQVGLRYINAIRPSNIDMNQSIETLISKEYLPFTSSNSEKIINSTTLIESQINEDVVCRSSFGLIHFLDDSKELGFLIDNDVIHTAPLSKIMNIQDILNNLNETSLNKFLKMTTETMHKAVGYR